MAELRYKSPRTGKVFIATPDDPTKEPDQEDYDWFAKRVEQLETGTEQSALGAMASSAAQGLTSIPGTVAQGVGALTGITSLEESGKYFADQARALTPIDPMRREDFSTKAAGAVGQAVGQLGVALATGGGSIGILGMAGAMGAASGAESAEARGLTGVRRYGEILGYGATEIVSERLFGLGSKSFFKPATDFQAKVLKTGKTIGGEAVEEAVAGLGTNIVSNLTALGTNIPTPDILSGEAFKGYVEQALLGAVGGTVFAGAQLAMKTQATEQSVTKKTAMVDGEERDVTGVSDEDLVSRGVDPTTIKVQTVFTQADAQAVDKAPTPGSKKIVEEIFANGAEVPLEAPTQEQLDTFDSAIAQAAAKKAEEAAAAGITPPEVAAPPVAETPPVTEAPITPPAVEPTQTPTPTPNATQIGQVSEGNIVQYPSGNEVGTPPETGDRNRPVEGGQVEQAVAQVPTVEQPLPSGALPTETGTLPKTPMTDVSGGVAAPTAILTATPKLDPRDKTYAALLAKGTPVGENLVELTEKQVSPALRKKLQSDRDTAAGYVSRPQETESFYLRFKGDVTGNPSDRGWILKDKRPDFARRFTPTAQTPTPTAAAPVGDNTLAAVINTPGQGPIATKAQTLLENVKRNIKAGVPPTASLTPDGNIVFPTPEAAPGVPQQARRTPLNSAVVKQSVQKVFGIVPKNIEFIDTDERVDGKAFVKEQRVQINLRYIQSKERLEKVLREEAFHLIYQDPLVQADVELLKQEIPDDIKADIDQLYSDPRFTDSVRLEESVARLVERLSEKTAWQRFVGSVRAAFQKLFGRAPSPRELTLAANRILERAIANVAVQQTAEETQGAEDAGDVRMSFAGEQSLQNLPEEKRRFMTDSLDAAKAMAAAGKSSEEIRAVTGWFPGKYDGKMRYEVPDTDAEFTKKGFGKSGKLDSVLIHPDLYDVYPRAKNINLVWDPNLKARGIFEEDSNTIYINSNGGNQLRTLLHELQHWIQSREGFATGTNPFAESSKAYRAKTVTDAQYKLGKAWRAIPVSLRLSVKDSMRDRFGSGILSTTRLDLNDAASLDSLDNWETAVYFFMTSPEFNQVKEAFRNLMEARDSAYEGKETDIGYDRYTRSAGEIEARDVQARLDFFSDEQRKATAPYSSENIAKEDAIVMFGSGGPQMSISPESQRIDQEYLAAVEAGDMETAQRIVDEAAKAAGGKAVFRYVSRDGMGMLNSKAYNIDKLNDDDASDLEEWLNYGLEQPRDVAQDQVFYFTEDGKLTNEEGLRLLKKAARRGFFEEVRFVFGEPSWATNDGQIAVNPNQIKSANAVERDDAGNIIPPSKRFQKTSDDIRYSLTPQSPETQIEQEYKVSVERGNAAVIASGHELTREVYDELKSKFKPKPRDVFYVADTEVIRNPSDSDRRRMSAEVRSEFGRDSSGDPATRFTNDTFSNTWIWKSHQGMHFQIEPGITSREGVEVNQNNHVPDHFELVQDALRANKPVPLKVQEQYPHYAKFFAKLPPYETSRKTSDDIRYSVTPAQQQVDQEYLAAVEAGDMETAQRIIADKAQKSGLPVLDESNVTAYKVRRKPAPQKTEKAYKLFRVKKGSPGEVFALFVGANDPLPQGVWLDATEGPRAEDSKTGKAKVKSKLGPLAYRPGWHAGDVPLATHIGASDVTGGPIVGRKFDEVWAEVDMASDVDYQPEANANGVTKDGSVSVALADIKKMPEDGLYRYKTNPNMTGQWIISGSMKVNRILSENEVNSILEKASLPTMPWMAKSKVSPLWEKTSLDLSRWGLGTNPARNQKKLLDPVTYDDAGNIIPPSQRFDPEKSDIRYSVTPTAEDANEPEKYFPLTVQIFGEKVVATAVEVQSIREIYETVKSQVFDYTQEVSEDATKAARDLFDRIRPTEEGPADISWLKEIDSRTATPGAVIGALYAYSDKMQDGGRFQQEILDAIELSKYFPTESFTDFWTASGTGGTLREAGRGLNAVSYLINGLNKLQNVHSNRRIRIQAAAKNLGISEADVRAIDNITSVAPTAEAVAEKMDEATTKGGNSIIDTLTKLLSPSGSTDPTKNPDNSPATDPKSIEQISAQKLVKDATKKDKKPKDTTQTDAVTAIVQDHLEKKGGQLEADLTRKLTEAGMSPEAAKKLATNTEKKLERDAKKESEREAKALEGAKELSDADRVAQRITKKLLSTKDEATKRKIHPIVALVARYFKANGKLSEEQLENELASLGVSTEIGRELVDAATAELKKRQAIKAARDKARKDNAATKSAENFTKNWEKSQDPAQQTEKKAPDPVRAFLNEQSKVLRNQIHFDLSPNGKALFFDTVYTRLINLNVSPEAAMAATSAAYQKYLTNRANKIAKLRDTVAKEGLSKALAKQILNLTRTQQRDPEFAKQFIEQTLIDAGVPQDIANASVPLLLPSFQKALADAREKALMDFINGRPPSAKRIPKEKLDDLRKAVRLGATNPDYQPSTPFAKANGWQNFTRAEHDEMARQDEIASDPLQTNQERQLALSKIAKIASKRMPKNSKLNLASEIYRNSALSNFLSTGGIQLWTPAFAAAVRTFTDGVRGLTQERNLNRFIASLEGFLRAASPTALKAELISSFGQNITTYNKAYEIDDLSQLHQLLLEGIETWKTTKSPLKKAKSLISITYGSMDYVRRSYASLDNVSQSVFYRQIMDLGMRDIILSKGGSETEFKNLISNRTRRHEQIVTELISQGQSPSRAWVNASELSYREMNGDLVDLYGDDVAVEIQAKDEMSRKEAARELGVAPDTELDGHVIPVLIDTIKGLSKAADNRFKDSGKLTTLILFGFPITALKVMNRSLDYSPIGILRGAMSERESKQFANDPEYKSSYPSYKTDTQKQQRMAEAAVGTAAMIMFLMMVLNEREKEPEDRLFMVHNAGPRDRAARQIWRAAGNEPQSVQFRFSKDSPWLGISWAKAGLEVFTPVFATAGATFDSMDPTIRREDAYDQIMVFFSQTLASMSRPLSSIQDTAGVVSGKEMSLSGRSLANQIGFRASSFLPWSSMARNYNKWQGARDTSNAGSAFAAMIPIVGPSLTEPALNSLGDPVGKTPNEYSYKIGTAIPVSVGFRREDTPLYEFLLNKGKFPTAISRPTQEKKYGQMTNETWRKFVEIRGQTLKSLILQRKESLDKMDSEKYDDMIENLTRIANDRARNQLKLRPAKK